LVRAHSQTWKNEPYWEKKKKKIKAMPSKSGGEAKVAAKIIRLFFFFFFFFSVCCPSSYQVCAAVRGHGVKDVSQVVVNVVARRHQSDRRARAQSPGCKPHGETDVQQGGHDPHQHLLHQRHLVPSHRAGPVCQKITQVKRKEIKKKKTKKKKKGWLPIIKMACSDVDVGPVLAATRGPRNKN
jgi:hypothetical protein